jgi:hypothetical protein
MYKPLLKVKLQQIDENTDIKNAMNNMVKTLNSSFQPTQFSMDMLGNTFTSAYNIPPGAFSNTITISHGLGVTPRGFLLLYIKPTTSTSGDRHEFYLSSMDSINITIAVKGTVTAGDSGEYKFLILR